MNHASSLREPRSRKRRTTADDAVIGQTLRARRLDRGLSQSELGHAAGVTFQQLQKYEKGTNRVSAARLARIAAELNVPVTAFYGAARARAPTRTFHAGPGRRWSRWRRRLCCAPIGPSERRNETRGLDG